MQFAEHVWQFILAKRDKMNGGEGGIRTHVPVARQDAFEAPPLRPLRYLSVEADCAKRTFDYNVWPANDSDPRRSARAWTESLDRADDRNVLTADRGRTPASIRGTPPRGRLKRPRTDGSIRAAGRRARPSRARPT